MYTVPTLALVALATISALAGFGLAQVIEAFKLYKELDIKIKLRQTAQFEDENSKLQSRIDEVADFLDSSQTDNNNNDIF